jgi:hypothetical protein
MTDEISMDDDWDWAYETPDWVPPTIDTNKPSVARMYDFFLGGKDHFAVDREAASQFLKGYPDVADVARANRGFLARSIRAMAEAGIDQFLDLGTGIPTSPSVHEVARQVHPGASVVYVDNDPVVVTHNQARLADDDRVITVGHDLREPDELLDDPQVRAVLDFDRPVGLLMIAVLHFVSPSSEPRVAGRYLSELSPGSQVAVTIGVRDGVDPAILAEHERVYSRSNAPIHLRTLAQVEELLDGLDVVAPGIEDVHFTPHGRVVGARALR